MNGKDKQVESNQVIPKLRRGRVLTPAQFGCLSGSPTLNVTNGCIFRCSYCYARGYRQAPKKGKVELYVNLPDLLQKELSERRRFPQWAILNTSSDCFQSHPDILHVTHEVIRILLDHGVGISFLTKGFIPPRFFDLFGRYPDKVLAQIGLVSLSEPYWRRYEAGTPSPEKRLENIQKLKEVGISPEIRIDPIIPFITDRETELVMLFERLKNLEVRRVTLSYLHLRPAIQKQLMQELTPLHHRLIESLFRTQDWKTVGSSTKTKLLPKVIREKGYQRIKEIAEGFGIEASVCQCKNPDVGGDLCGSGRVRAFLGRRTQAQLPLFRC